MFFNVLYFNDELFNRYTSILNPGNNFKYSTVETSAKHGGEMGIGRLKLDRSSTSKFIGEFNESSNSKILMFEKMLSTHDDYYADFVEGEVHKELSEITKNMIIKIPLSLYIHEEFDQLEIIESFKDKILDPDLYELRDGEEEMFKQFMDFKELKIPVYNDNYEQVFFSKLQKNHFEISSESLDDLENEVIVLAQVKKAHKGSVEIFNPIKDLFSFPRQLRRELTKKNDDKFKPIIIESKDSFELDIIAIYE